MSSVDELFDIVDASDRVVGSGPRSEIHARGQLHRAVHLWLYDPNGRILLQRRSLSKDREPGKWTSSVSGHVNAGEAYDAAILREIPEEIGVPASSCRDFGRVGYFPACQETGQEFVWLYRAVHAGPFQPDPTEVAGLEWFPPDQLEAKMKNQPQEFSSCLLHLWQRRPK
ncbi:MAG: NUDIX domain-containing protein [Verrucomicrobia bacterium]|nr:NUDIX domain-containing protein [Verrucomicrobiota bacterium]